MHASSDEQIVEDVLKGDTQAFGLIIRRYEKPIFNLMARATGSLDEAADLCQDAFLRAYEKVETYRPGKKFYSWLYAIALNIVRDEMRHRRTISGKAEQKSVKGYNFESMYFNASDPERLPEDIGLYQALASISLEYREAVLLRYKEGLAYREIATMLEISVSGAKMRVRRGLERLRQQMVGKKHEHPNIQ